MNQFLRLQSTNCALQNVINPQTDQQTISNIQMNPPPKDNISEQLKTAFNLLLDSEYKRTSMFFIELPKIKELIGSDKQTYRSMEEKQVSMWEEEMKRFQEQKIGLKVITSVNLECSAHGVFDKNKLANNFLNFLQEIFEYKGDGLNLKKLKLKISGFNLNSSEYLYKIRQKKGQKVFQNEKCEFSFIHRLKKIIQMGRNNLESLELRINNVRYCKKEDLRDVMRLGFYESKTLEGGSKLTNLSLELSDWMFHKIVTKEVKKQEKQNLNETTSKINPVKTEKVCQNDWLTSDEFKDIVLGSILQQGAQKQDPKKLKMPLMKRLRLQLSTLFYQKQSFQRFKHTLKPQQYKKQNNQAKYKLKNKNVTQGVQYFHYLMREFVKDIVTVVMPKLTTLELDFRNWCSEMQMKEMKDELVNINRKYEMEMIRKEEEGERGSQSVRSRSGNNKRSKNNQNAIQQVIMYLVKAAQKSKIEEFEDVPLTIMAVV